MENSTHKEISRKFRIKTSKNFITKPQNSNKTPTRPISYQKYQNFDRFLIFTSIIHQNQTKTCSRKPIGIFPQDQKTPEFKSSTKFTTRLLLPNSSQRRGSLQLGPESAERKHWRGKKNVGCRLTPPVTFECVSRVH
jgi:hypothetical protein